MVGSEGVQRAVSGDVVQTLDIQAHVELPQRMLTEIDPLSASDDDGVQEVLVYEFLQPADNESGDFLPPELRRDHPVKVNQTLGICLNHMVSVFQYKREYSESRTKNKLSPYSILSA